ncbi:S8 family serine peptidase, partial [bacterium]|nr:S8 family serine peptidase [bacterium]
MRRFFAPFFLIFGIVFIAQARYLEPSMQYATTRFIVNTWPESADLSPQISENLVILSDPELTSLNEKWGIIQVERLFPDVAPERDSKNERLSTYWRFWLESGTVTEALLEDFAKALAVEHVEPVAIHPVCFQPDDPSYSYQWYLQNSPEDHDVDAPEAWSVQRGSPDVIIGVMDTGVQYGHPDLAANIWTNDAELNGTSDFDDDGNGYEDDYYGWDFIVYEMAYPGEDGQYQDNDPTDFVGHGTHIAGITAAVLNNKTGVSGIAGGGIEFGGARIMPLRIGWLAINGYAYVAMDYAARAVNYGRQKGVTVFTCAWTSSYATSLNAAVNEAIAEGIIFCVAAGNSNSDQPYYLSSRGDCIDIAAINENDIKTSSSNYGTWVDICAPGQSIYSTSSHQYTNTYDYENGTSMASAMGAGAVALIKSQQPDWNREQITAALLVGVDNIYSLNPDYIGQLGSGRLNLNLVLMNTGSYSLMSPNGGETWELGDSATVRWESSLTDGDIILSLNYDYPDGEWEEIYTGTPDADSVTIIVSGTASPNARLRIQSELAPLVNDLSDDDFEIGFPSYSTNPSFNLLTPDGGEKLTIGDWHRITWTTSYPGPTVTISLNRDYPDGAWEDILTHVYNMGNVLWRVDGPPTSNARLRIKGDESPTLGGVSDGDFSISLKRTEHIPAFQVLSPTSESVWMTGEENTITWSSDGDCETVRIRICKTYPEGPCETIAITPNDLTESWEVFGWNSFEACIVIECMGQHESAVASGNFTLINGADAIATRQGDDIIVQWNSNGAESYNIYSSSNAIGPFT